VAPTSHARVGGKAARAGGNIDIKGAVGSHLTAAGGAVKLDAPVGGDVEISARDIDIGPNADIRGTLTYWSAQRACIDPAAKIAGEVTFHPMDMPRGMRGAGIVAALVGGLLMFLAFAVLGALLVLIFPEFTKTVERNFAASPGKSFLLGLGLLVGLPLLAVLFFLTIIGIPVGMLVLFVYPLVLMIGYVTAALFLGDRLLAWLRRDKPLTKGVRIGGLIAALVLLALLNAVPVLGALVAFAVVMIALGAWAMSLYRRYRVAPAA
jgi:hypothetical protein